MQYSDSTFRAKELPLYRFVLQTEDRSKKELVTKRTKKKKKTEFKNFRLDSISSSIFVYFRFFFFFQLFRRSRLEPA